jgi:hypothetical protein
MLCRRQTARSCASLKKKSSDFSRIFFLFFFAGELNLMAEEADKLLSQREEEWERLAAKASEV